MLALLTIILAFAFTVTIAQRANPDWNLTPRIFVGLISGVTIALALGMITGSASGDEIFTAGVPGFENASRLCPSKSLLFGYKMYYQPGAGPLLATMYPPGMYFFYLPIALLPLPTTWLVILGSLLSFIWCLCPGLAYLWRRFPFGGADPLFWLALNILVLLFFQFRSLCYSTTSIHADAPALGCIAWAALVLYSGATEPLKRDIILGAFMAACGVWCKQVMIVAPFVFAALTWKWHGQRKALLFAAWFAMFAVTLGAGFSAIFGVRELVLHVIEIPGRMAWWRVADNASVLSAAGGGAHSFVDRAKTLWVVLDSFMAERWLLLAFIGTALFGYGHRRNGSLGSRARGQIPMWAVFFSLAAAFVPMALMACAKIGGAKNSFSVFDYFAVLGAIQMLGDFAGCHGAAQDQAPRKSQQGRRRTMMVFCSSLCLALIIALKAQVIRTQRYVMGIRTNTLTESETFIRRHPGEAYFASNPIAHLQVEGILYHYQIALRDYYLSFGSGQIEKFRTNVPSDFRLLVVSGYGLTDVDRLLFPEYNVEIAEPGLSRWRVFARKSRSDVENR